MSTTNELFMYVMDLTAASPLTLLILELTQFSSWAGRGEEKGRSSASPRLIISFLLFPLLRRYYFRVIYFLYLYL